MLRVFILLMSILYASSMFGQTTTVTQSVYEWLAINDRGDFALSWQQAAPQFKRNITQSDWLAAISAARQPLGVAKRREVVDASLMMNPENTEEGEYIVFTLNTDFDKKPNATETVTVKNAGDQWLVVGYFIQ